MDIFEFALRMELDGEQYYRDIAGKVKSSDLRKVLESLAEDEQRHYEIIQSIQKQDLYNVEVNPSLGKTLNVFAVNKGNGLSTDDKVLLISELNGEQADEYRAALAKEKESVVLYGKLRDNARSQKEKIICEKLMQEEEKHAQTLESIIDMLNHVHDWVESAEFNHLADKY